MEGIDGMEPSSHEQEESLFKGKKSLKAMLTESEDILKKNGGPTFLKRQPVVDVSVQDTHPQSNLARAQEVQVLRDLINTIPERIERHEQRMEDLIKEAHLVLASLRAQSSPPLTLTRLTDQRAMPFKQWGGKALSMLLLVIIAALSFLVWQNKQLSPSMGTGQKPAMKELIIKPRSNLRLSPSLDAKIVMLLPSGSKAVAVQEQGNWYQVVAKQPGKPDNLGWIHRDTVESVDGQK